MRQDVLAALFLVPPIALMAIGMFFTRFDDVTDERNAIEALNTLAGTIKGCLAKDSRYQVHTFGSADGEGKDTPIISVNAKLKGYRLVNSMQSTVLDKSKSCYRIAAIPTSSNPFKTSFEIMYDSDSGEVIKSCSTPIGEKGFGCDNGTW